MVHKWIPIEYAFPHFNDVKIMVSKSHTIPEEGAIARLIRFSVSVFANYVLNSI